MSDLIDREDLINGIYNDNPRDVLGYIAKFPSAEPKKGKWAKDNYGGTVCSECLRIRRDNRINHINFCNSCGADMRGEECD